METQTLPFSAERITSLIMIRNVVIKTVCGVHFNSFELESALMKRIRFPSQRADLLVNIAAAVPHRPCL